LSNRARLPRAVLDTQVIYSRVLHELLGRLASELRFINLIWSDELLAEAARVLTERKPMDAAVAARWVNYMRVAFPNGKIEITDMDPNVRLDAMTVDIDDQHVCALAIAGEADLLITSDKGYNAAALAKHGIQLVTPDAYLKAPLRTTPTTFLRSLLRRLKHGPAGAPWKNYDAIERAQANEFVSTVRRAHRTGT
jgi:predicted nucleic acid-binding protein